MIVCPGEDINILPSRSYMKDDANRQVVESVHVLEDVTCDLVVTDSAGNGINNGTIELYFGNDITNPNNTIVNSTGDFTDRVEIKFDVPEVAASPSQEPSYQPTLIEVMDSSVDDDFITVVIQLGKLQPHCFQFV